MDSTETVTHIGLCAGYGGIELGLKRVIPNLRSVALCEIEAFACANLVAKMEAGLMDPAPVWSDLKTFPWGAFRGRVDILTGGYPCQPFSAAGKRLGGEDQRHLWPNISGGIRLLRPALCFFENVEGHITQGLHYVLSDLGELGYRTTWGLFSASECGAPHQRKRVFILAYRADCGRWQDWMPAKLRAEMLEQPSGDCRGSDEGKDGQERQAWPSRPGEPQHAWEPPRLFESTLGRYSDGPAGRMDYAQLCVSCDNRTDELRLLGNGVVPATAELAFRTLIQELLQ